MRFVKVAVPIKYYDTFTYRVPENMEIKKGSVVRVSFRNLHPIGVVVGEAEEFRNAKTIAEKILDLPEQLFKLGEWLSSYYLSPPGEVFSAILPPLLKRVEEPFHSKSTKFKISLNKEQKNAVELISPYIENKSHRVFLLFGVTGSGKTEIYLRLMKHAISMGKSVLYLLPEIGMVPQSLERVRERLGVGDEYHSKVTPGGRYSVWMNSLEGRVRVAVGARMGVFLPMKNLGFIVIDEEHDSSYRQTEKEPRYSARDTAVMRAMMENIPIILGSATPSIESFYNGKIGKYEIIRLKNRVADMKLPSVNVVGLKGKKILSDELKERIEKVSKKGKVIIYLNRRGYSPFIFCENCHYIAKCPYCDIPLTYHRKEGVFLCHHCGYRVKSFNKCPKCGGSLTLSSIGTERVEEELRETYGSAITRMDRDALKKRQEHEKVYLGLRDGEIRVLVGTQMVTKGFDFPDVKLVVVLKADNILNFPDFRASERTFQTLSQVAGRAGRGEKGEALIQTNLPEHYAIKFASRHDYEGFFDKEIEFRKRAGYPPFYRLGRIVLSSSEIRMVQKKAEQIEKELRKYRDIQVLGPSICPIKRVRGRYRYHILLKSKKIGSIQRALLPILKTKGDKVRTSIEIDPLDMM